MNTESAEKLIAELIQIGSSEKVSGTQKYFPIPFGIPGLTSFSSWESERTISIGEDLLRLGGPELLEKAQQRVLERLGNGALFELQTLWRMAKLRAS